VGIDELTLVGGKNASLGELIKLEGIKVPNGFAITTHAFKRFVEPVRESVAADLERLRENSYQDVTLLDRVSREIRARIEQQPFDKAFETEMEEAYRKLDPVHGVAVRSSATAEDLPEASFAGQQDTFLNVGTFADVLDKTRKCFSSLYTARAMSYRYENEFPEEQVSLSVGVQKMVRADWNGVSGVMFTIDTETGNENLILITPHRGLGEAIVQGEVKPDEIYVLRHSLRVIQNPMQILEDELYTLLARQALHIEDHYGKKYGRRVYMDIEWAQDGQTGELFILQARPETIHSRATIAAWQVRPPSSVTIAEAFFMIGSQSGSVMRVTSTSPSLKASIWLTSFRLVATPLPIFIPTGRPVTSTSKLSFGSTKK